MADQIDEMVKEQPKAAPEMTASPRPLDKTQRAASMVLDFENRQIVLNVIEGEDLGDGFVPVRHVQRTITTKAEAIPVLAAMASKTAAKVVEAAAAVTLSEGTRIVEESP